MSSKTGGGGSGSVPKHGSSSSLSQQEHHTLPPLLISDSSHIRDTLLCLLSTVLFCRSLGPIVVEDVTCDFCDVTYCRAKTAKTATTTTDDDDVVKNVRKYLDEKIQRVIEHCAQTALGTHHHHTGNNRVREVTVLLHFYEKTLTKKTSTNNSNNNNSPRNATSWKNSISEGAMSSLTNRIRNEDVQTKKLGRKWETWQISLEMWDEDALLVSSRGESLEKQRERAANDLAETLSGTITHILALCEEKKEHVPPVLTERMPSFPFEIELVEIKGTSGSGSQGGVFSNSFGMLKKLLKDSTPTQLI